MQKTRLSMLRLTLCNKITDPYNSNPLIRKILFTLSTLHSINSNITFIWVPGRIGFPEHDKVDSAAKRTTAFPTITEKSLIPVSDYRNHYCALILKKWNTFWNNQLWRKHLR